MYVELPAAIYKCSLCGGSDIETFKNNRKSGKRCLSCGYEKKDKTAKNSYQTGCYTASNELIVIVI